MGPRSGLAGGDLALDFANTVEGPRGGARVRDRLTGYDELAAWAGDAGAVEPSAVPALVRLGAAQPGRARAALAEALRLRDAIVAVFDAVAAGAPPPPERLSALLAADAAALAHATLRPAGDRYEPVWDVGGLGRPWWPVAHAAIDLLRSDRLARVKGCGRCCWLFVDETKNRSRRWCSMDDCGTTEKLERRAAARAARR